LILKLVKHKMVNKLLKLLKNIIKKIKKIIQMELFLWILICLLWMVFKLLNKYENFKIKIK